MRRSVRRAVEKEEYGTCRSVTQTYAMMTNQQSVDALNEKSSVENALATVSLNAEGWHTPERRSSLPLVSGTRSPQTGVDGPPFSASLLVSYPPEDHVRCPTRQPRGTAARVPERNDILVDNGCRSGCAPVRL